MSKLNFALDKSTIGSYVNATGQEVISKNILAGETISAIEVKPGIKYKEEIKILATNVLLQAYTCGTPTTSGTTTLTKKDIEVKPFMVYETLCPSDLNDTSYMLSQKRGLDQDLPFEAKLLELKAQGQKAAVENKIWVQASSSTYTAGFLNQFDADSAVVDYVFDFSSGLTDSERIAGYVAMIEKIPAEIVGMDDLTLFIGHEEFAKLSRSFLNTANTLLQKFDFNGVDGLYLFPGYEKLKIKAVNGLNVANNADHRCVITPASNLIYGCDLENDETEMYWSKEQNALVYMSTWKFGVAYKFSEYVVNNQKS